MPRHRHRMRTPRLPLAVIATALASVLVVGIGMGYPGARIESTDASWTDAQYATGSASALTVPPVTITSCRFQGVSVVPLVTTPYFELTWKFATGSGYDSTNNLIVVKSATSGLGGVLEPIVGGNGLRTIGPDASGAYTTDIETGLLGNVLGGQFDLGIVAQENFSGTIWQSVPARVAAQTNLAGLTGSCSIS